MTALPEQSPVGETANVNVQTRSGPYDHFMFANIKEEDDGVDLE